MTPASPIRLAELLMSLSLAIDVGLGLPMATMLRVALVSARLARAAGLSPEAAQAAYYLALLRFVGCTTTSHDDSFLLGGDELALSDLIVVDDDQMQAVVARAIGAGKSPEQSAAAVGHFFAMALSGGLAANHAMHCEAAQIIANRLQLGPLVSQGLAHHYERWDGRGSLHQVAGAAISLPMRVVQVAMLASVVSRDATPQAVGAQVAARAGRQLDPGLAALFASDPKILLDDLDAPDLMPQVLAAEPGPVHLIEAAGLDRGLTAVADFGDFKSPHMLGHSRRVAALAEAAARAASMPAADVAMVRHAGLVHDIGRVGVPAQLLSKGGALSASEHERIRLHPYLAERMFAAAPLLAPIGRIGAMHHERLDGTGYHRGLAAAQLPATARLLAAANAFCALTEPRPHRQTLTEAEAAVALAAHGRAGLLDAKSVDAVLTAAGQRPRHSRRAAAIALSDREVEVLRLVAGQRSSKDIARALAIAPKTVERHITHIYDKLGVTTRAGAALYASDNGLI